MCFCDILQVYLSYLLDKSKSLSFGDVHKVKKLDKEAPSSGQSQFNRLRKGSGSGSAALRKSADSSQNSTFRVGLTSLLSSFGKGGRKKSRQTPGG